MTLVLRAYIFITELLGQQYNRNMNSNHPLVACRIFGQLGNQLYQIAATLAYARDYDAIPIFLELHKQEDRISYNRDRIFFRLDTSKPAM